MLVHCLTFNPFQENTYLLEFPDKKCLLVDPGNYTKAENRILDQFIESNGLKIQAIILTHAHIDHIMGVFYCQLTYGVDTYVHVADMVWYSQAETAKERWGLVVNQPNDANLIKNSDSLLDINGLQLEIRHVPGHSPGHVVFIDHASKQIIGGDVLFENSIGRTDLPFCNHDQLIKGIKKELFVLDDDYKVYPGHGGPTSIGNEKKYNPFLQ